LSSHKAALQTDAECGDGNNGFGRGTWFGAKFSILMNGGITTEKLYSKKKKKKEKKKKERKKKKCAAYSQLINPVGWMATTNYYSQIPLVNHKVHS